MRTFKEFAVVDWSGENVARPNGLAVAHVSAGERAPVLLRPAEGWSRESIAEWLVRLAEAGTDILVGLDLSPALPFVDQGSYFPGWHQSPENAHALWELVEELASGDAHLAVGGFLAHAEARRHFRQHRNCGDQFEPGRGRLRVCEHGQQRMGLSPQSCFNLVGAAQVGKSSLTGMRVMHRLRGNVPVWPIDPLPAKGPLIVEIYTSIAAKAGGLRKGLSKIRDGATLDQALQKLGSDPHRPLLRYDDHSTDAILTAAWLRASAQKMNLWHPPGLTPEIARTEGWTFGVT